MIRRVLTVLGCCLLAMAGPGAPSASAKPNPPQNVTAQARSHQLTIGWLVLADDGWGGPIDNYQISVVGPSGARGQFSSTSPVNFYDLRHGTYTYYVAAHNADGWSHASTFQTIDVPSEPDRMAVPRASTITPDTLTVTWVPPGSDGLSPITGYQVRFDGDVYDVPATASSKTFTAPGGTKHSMQVRAGNVWGWGEFSGTHDATALGSPGPVQSVTATATATTVHVTWQQPAETGGRAIDHYLVQLARGSDVQQKTGTFQAEFTGLEPDTDYRVNVTPVGNDPTDGMGELLGPSESIGVHTGPAPATGPTTGTTGAPGTSGATPPPGASGTASTPGAPGTSGTAGATPPSTTPTATSGATPTSTSAPTTGASSAPGATGPDPAIAGATAAGASANTTPSDGAPASTPGPGSSTGAAAASGLAAGAELTTAIDPPAGAASAGSDHGPPGWLWWLIGAGAGALLLAAATGMVILGRRRAGQPG